MVFVLVVPVLLYIVDSVYAEPACIFKSPNGCTSVDQWKSDLLCRIMGPSDEPGGYMFQMARMDTQGDKKTEKRLRKALNYLTKATAKIETRIDDTTSQKKAFKQLAKIEKRINKYGRKLFEDQWATYTCGVADPTGEPLSKVVPCGDLSSRKSEVCKGGPIPPTKVPIDSPEVEEESIENENTGEKEEEEEETVLEPGVMPPQPSPAASATGPVESAPAPAAAVAGTPVTVIN